VATGNKQPALRFSDPEWDSVNPTLCHAVFLPQADGFEYAVKTLAAQKIVAVGRQTDSLESAEIYHRPWAELTLVHLSPQLTTYPEAFDEAHSDVAYFRLVTGSGATPKINHWSHFKTRLAFAAPAGHHQVQLREVHVLTMLAEQAARNPLLETGKHLVAFAAENHLFLLGWDAGQLQLASVLPGTDDETLLYSVMFAAEQAGFNYRTDTVWLAGPLPENAGFPALLQQYWKNVAWWGLPTGVKWAPALENQAAHRWSALIPVME
jgi:hypothetical protein